MLMMPIAEMAEACVDSQRQVVKEMAMQTNHDLVGNRRNCEVCEGGVVVGVVVGGGNGKG